MFLVVYMSHYLWYLQRSRGCSCRPSFLRFETNPERISRKTVCSSLSAICLDFGEAQGGGGGKLPRCNWNRVGSATGTGIGFGIGCLASTLRDKQKFCCHWTLSGHRCHSWHKPQTARQTDTDTGAEQRQPQRGRHTHTMGQLVSATKRRSKNAESWNCVQVTATRTTCLALDTNGQPVADVQWSVSRCLRTQIPFYWFGIAAGCPQPDISKINTQIYFLYNR